MIKGITFDLDGVYFLNGKSNFIRNLKKLGVPESEAERVFLKSDEMNNLYKCGKMTDEEFWSWAIKQWGLKKTKDEIISLLIKGYEINEDVVRTLEILRNKGYKTLICSNNFHARVNGLQKRFRFLDNFDTAVFSCYVGVTKPDNKIFLELVKKSGLKAKEIIFADDNNENLKGAKSTGIQTLYYEGYDNFINNLRNIGVDL